MIESKKHGTAEELKFIAGIGTFAEEMPAIDSKLLLKRYIAALHKRTDWAGINKDKVIAHAINRLNNLNYGVIG